MNSITKKIIMVIGMSALGLILFSPVNAISIAQEGELVCDETTICNEEKGFSISIPDGWEEIDGGQEIDLMLLGPFSEEYLGTAANLIVIVEEVSVNIPAEVAFRSWEAGASQGLDMDIISRSDEEIGSLKVRTLKIEVKNTELKVEMKTKVIINGGRLFTVSATVLSDALEENQESIDLLFESLTIVEQEVSSTPLPSNNSSYVQSGYEAGRIFGSFLFLFLLGFGGYKLYQSRSRSLSNQEVEGGVTKKSKSKKYWISILLAVGVFIVMTIVGKIELIATPTGQLIFGILNITFTIAIFYGGLNLIVLGINKLTGK